MSSTSRGGQRLADDFYRTPSWTTRLIVPKLHLVGAKSVLDPAAGDGAIMDVVREDTAIQVNGIEIDPGRARASNSLCADALAISWGQPDIVVMNQPYSLAIEFCEKALAEVKPGGDVAALMRSSMFWSDARADFWAKHPADMFAIKRPSFTEHLRYSKERGETACRKPVGKSDKCRRPLGHDGECMSCGTDSCDYAWFVFGAGRGNRIWRLDE